MVDGNVRQTRRDRHRQIDNQKKETKDKTPKERKESGEEGKYANQLFKYKLKCRKQTKETTETKHFNSTKRARREREVDTRTNRQQKQKSQTKRKIQPAKPRQNKTCVSIQSAFFVVLVLFILPFSLSFILFLLSLFCTLARNDKDS
jgi:hypothetical protein